MRFRRIFADDGQGYLKTSKVSFSVWCRQVLEVLSGKAKSTDYFDKDYARDDIIGDLKVNNIVREDLYKSIIEEINELRKNVTEENDLTKKIQETVNNSNVSTELSVCSRLYIIIYGKEAYKGILSIALRGKLDDNVQKLLEAIQDLNKSKTSEGIEDQLKNIQGIVSKIPDKDIKSLMRKAKEEQSKIQSSLAKTSADYKTIGKALVNGLVRATMNVIREAEKDKGVNDEKRERLLQGLYNIAGKYLSNYVLKSYKTVLDNTLKQWNQNLLEKNEISKDTNLRDYSIRMLTRIGVFNVENYGLWMLHATEQYFKERGMPTFKLPSKDDQRNYLKDQWESRYSEDFKDLVANETIRLLNEDYASNEDFANKWDTYKVNLNQSNLENCIGGYVNDAYESLGSQRMDEYYFGKKFKRIDDKKGGKDVRDELLKEVKEELAKSVLSN